MEGSPGPSDLQEQLKEREAEVGVLRNRLSQAQEEIDRLRRENEQLRQELRASGRGSARGQSKRKAKRKRSGRKAGKGRFTFRGAPASAVTKGPSQPVPVTITQCPCCGGALQWERTDEVTESAVNQDAMKKSTGVIGNAYQQLRAGVALAPVTYTDDTGWRIHGQAAHLMAFDTDQATVFQIRSQHRNEEVRELIPADYAGVMVTDRGKSYEADELSDVDQQKCLDHLKRNIDEVLETKTGGARSFGLKLKKILRDARQLWRDQRAGKAKNFQARAEKFDKKLTYHLRHRSLQDQDNQRLLDGIGLQHDLGRVLRILHNPAVEPTNNRGERAVRPPVIARKLSHGSKNVRGAEAFSAFTSVIQTAVKRRASSTFDALHHLFGSKTTVSSTKAHPPPS